MLPVTCFLCHFFSWESLMVLEAAVTALWTPPAPLWGTGLLCLGHMGTWKKQQGCAQGLVPACQQPISTDAAACFRLMPQHLLSSSPWKAGRTSPALFSPGKSENYSPQLRARQSESLSAWWEWAVQSTGGEGDAGLLCSSIGAVPRNRILALSLRAGLQQQEHTGVSVPGWAPLPLLLAALFHSHF